jgi:hypothetical protein
MAFFSQTVAVPHGTATVLVSAQATNTIVYVQTATTPGVTIGDSGVGASGWPLPNFQMSFNLVAGDEIYGFYNSASGSANVQVLVGTVPA